MNREIEFRAFLFDKEIIAPVKCLDFEEQQLIALVQDDEYEDVIREVITHIDTTRLMQYTGLKDKNGVKIFEGDIIKGTKRNGTKYWEINFIGVVKFTNENKKSKFNIYVNEYKEFDFSACFGLEVIGNIYENPELLGGRDE